MSTTAVPAPGDSVALLLSSVSTASSAALGSSSAPVAGTSLPATTQASLSTDAGVVATLSTGAAPADSTTQLYDNLAALSVSNGAPQGAVNVNAEWASVLQSTPTLAPVAAQMGVNAAIVDTLA